VGKISGVTRLPANVVGAIDIHQRHTLADVAEDQVELVLSKLAGTRKLSISTMKIFGRLAYWTGLIFRRTILRSPHWKWCTLRVAQSGCRG
jgi:hypothetical protein